MSGDEWTRLFLRPTLDDAVPEEVRALFAVAQGTLSYGYFFYPLYALGEEQLFRVAETAAKKRVEELSGKRPAHFGGAVAALRKADLLVDEQITLWEALRRLRNAASHPEYQTVLPPGSVLATLEQIARAINALWRIEPNG